MINIIIPMAGRGSRFSVAGYKEPKPLIRIGDKRMIEVVVNNLRPGRPHRFIFVCQEEHIAGYGLIPLLENIAPGSVVVPIQGITGGAACTVLAASKYIDNDQPLMIANSDQWVDICIDDYLKKMDEQQLDGMIMTMTASDAKWSYVQCDEQGRVQRVVEKQVVSDEATVGIYNYRRGRDFCHFARQMVRNNDLSHGEFYVAPVYNYLLQKNSDCRIGIMNIGTEMHGMYGLGTPEDLQNFTRLPIARQAITF